MVEFIESGDEIRSIMNRECSYSDTFNQDKLGANHFY